MVVRYLFSLLFCALMPLQSGVASEAGAPETAVQIDLPAGPLDGAVTELSAQTGVQILAPSELVANHRVRPLKGRYTAEQALARLTADAGLEVRRVGQRALTLVRTPAHSPVQPEQPPSTRIDEIIVTGEKTDRSLFDTVTSVEVITPAQVEAYAIRDIPDSLLQMANVSSTSGGEGFNIRGMDHGGVSGGNGGLATLNIDGAQINGFGIRVGQLDIWDIAQVEVMRGAQSTTQGRNSLAGGIYVNSADPVHRFEAKARVQASSYDSRIASAAVNVPLVADTLALRIAADTRRSDGYIENPTLGVDDYARTRNTLARAKLLYEPKSAPGLRAMLTLSESRNESGDDVVRADDPFARRVYSNLDGHENLDQRIATLHLDYGLSDAWRLASITSHNDSRYDRLDDDDQSAAGGPNRRERINDRDLFSQEVRLHYTGERLRGLFGVLYLDEQADDDSFFLSGISVPSSLPAALAPAASLVAPYYEDPFLVSRPQRLVTSEENVAAFIDLDYALGARTHLLLGLRYDREKQRLETEETVTLGSPLPDVAQVPATPLGGGLTLRTVVGAVNGILNGLQGGSTGRSSTTFDAWLPKIGVSHSLSDDLVASFVVQRGYRAGGSGQDVISGLFEFDPEFTWNYELSLRARLFEDRALLRTNVFYVDWTDQQVLVEDVSTGGMFTDNAGKSRLRGFEIELAGQVSGALGYFVALGYTDTEFTDFTGATGDFTGDEFPNAARHSAAAGLTYRSARGLFANTSVHYRDDAFNAVPNNLRTDARTLVNANVGYRWGSYTASVFARNLFDEEYITSNVFRNNVLKVGEPRVVGIELLANW